MSQCRKMDVVSSVMVLKEFENHIQEIFCNFLYEYNIFLYSLFIKMILTIYKYIKELYIVEFLLI
jgi:hypothetical protein